MRGKFFASCASVALVVSSFGALTAINVAPAAAAIVTVPLTSQTSGIPIVGSQTSTKDQATTTTAPSSLFQNDLFTLSIGAPPETEGSDLGSGATLNNIHDIHVHIPIPANAQLLSFGFTPGFGYGSASP